MVNLNPGQITCPGCLGERYYMDSVRRITCPSCKGMGWIWSEVNGVDPYETPQIKKPGRPKKKEEKVNGVL